jgi:Pyruvate/2-oxoacid:ferredoxin oxidoreductase delta subunit
MSKRKIIEIDRDLCNGCGLCTTACMEGALVLDAEGKAVLVRELYCDGMGACLDVCPTDALKIVERDGEAYDPKETFEHVRKTRGEEAAQQVHGAGHAHHVHNGHDDHGHNGQGHSHGGPAGRKPAPHFAGGCPGSRAQNIEKEPEAAGVALASAVRSELTQWPIQLHLVSPFAPYFQGADLLIAADCTAFAMGGFHGDLLKGKKLVIACPKLDDAEGYVEKLADLIKRNNLRSLTVAIMTVPCCSGLRHMVEEAVALSGVDIVPRTVVVGIDGKFAG